jgi:FtsH-binding integral membrane protein
MRAPYVAPAHPAPRERALWDGMETAVIRVAACGATRAHDDVGALGPADTASAMLAGLVMDYASQGLLERSQERVSDALWITYRWMTLGLATTGVVALLVVHSPLLELLLHNRLLFFALIFGQLGLVVAFGSIARRVSSASAAAIFFVYAALTGVTLSTVFVLYTATSIATTFFITAGSFAGLSIFGAVTRRDLSAIGRFAIFALIGVIIASIVNIFLRSGGLDWVITLGGVVVFAVLIAYDTQRLKNLFASGEVHGNLPIVGALTLYLDFINMFLFLLRLFGDRRRG